MHIQDQMVLKEDCQVGSSQKREDSDGVFLNGFLYKLDQICDFPRICFFFV